MSHDFTETWLRTQIEAGNYVEMPSPPSWDRNLCFVALGDSQEAWMFPLNDQKIRCMVFELRPYQVEGLIRQMAWHLREANDFEPAVKFGEMSDLFIDIKRADVIFRQQTHYAEIYPDPAMLLAFTQDKEGYEKWLRTEQGEAWKQGRAYYEAARVEYEVGLPKEEMIRYKAVLERLLHE